MTDELKEGGKTLADVFAEEEEAREGPPKPPVGLILPGLLEEQVANIVGPWPTGPGSDTHLRIESGMDKLYSYVMRKMKRSRVYVSFRADLSRFQADFFIITTDVNDDMHTGQYMTSWLAVGMNEEQAAREGDLICKALATNLGQRIFIEGAPSIPAGAMIIKDMET